VQTTHHGIRAEGLVRSGRAGTDGAYHGERTTGFRRREVFMDQASQHTLSPLDAIFTRRSVRSYRPQVIDESTVRSLLDAAVQAPTAMHAEPWEFVIVQDPAMLARLSDRAKQKWLEEASHYRDLHARASTRAEAAFAERLADPEFSIFYDAGTLIAICAKRAPFAVADCWLAAENLMLAASALGLGTCCIGAAIPALNDTATKADLEMPADVDAVAAIVVGVPSGPATESARKAPYILSWTLRTAAQRATAEGAPPIR
jgi:nitroreductase